MGWFTSRRTLEDNTPGLLVAKSAEHLQNVTNDRARRYRSVSSIPGVLYEVKSMETRRNYVVETRPRKTFHLYDLAVVCLSMWPRYLNFAQSETGSTVLRRVYLHNRGHTRKHMSKRLSLSILQTSTETRCIPYLRLFQMRKILNRQMTPS